MDMKQWLADLKAVRQKKPMPILSFPSVQLLGIDVEKLISSAEFQAQGMKAVANRTDALASVSMMDLSVEAEAFGAKTHVSPDEVPTVVGHIVETQADADALPVPDVDKCRTRRYVDAIAEACRQITDRPVFAGAIGPFSLAGRLVDVSEAMIKCYEDPDMMHTVLDKASEFIVSYIRRFKEAGANGVVIAEPLAGLLSPALMEEFSTPYTKRVIEQTQDDEFLVIYHNCGNNTILLIDSILESGAGAYHFGNAIDLEEMLKKVPSDTVVMGNIDPAGEFRNGTPESIRKATLDLMERCCVYPNFVLSSGCDIPPMAKWENIDAFFEAADEFYRSERG